MLQEIFIENAAAIVGFFIGSGGLFAWWKEKKKNKVLVEGLEADNEKKSIDNASHLVNVYKDALDDLNTRYESKFNEITDLYERKIKALKEEIRIHKSLNSALKKQITQLKNRIKELER